MLVILAVLLSLQAITCNASAKTIYVESGNSIQKAIDSSNSGDTIIVNPGTYSGDIEISTANITVMSSSPYKAIIKAENNAFNIYEKNVTIKDFDIRGPGRSSGTCFSFGRNEGTNGAFYCTVQDNKIYNFNMAADVGFYMYSGSEYILNNEIYNCETGVYAFDLMFQDITVSGNKITGCDNGLYLVDAPCTVTNNNFNNTVNVNISDGTENIFNTTKTSGVNIVGGSYLGGNCWATPSGDGFSQTHSDKNRDGFADEPYKLEGSNYVDYLPLVPLNASFIVFSEPPAQEE